MTDSVDRTATVARRVEALAEAMWDHWWEVRGIEHAKEAWSDIGQLRADQWRAEARSNIAALDAHDAAHPQEVVDRLVAAGVLERCRVKSENRVTHVYVEVVPDPDGPLYRVVPS